MIILIVGNLIALVASLIMAYTGTLKNKKKILYFQTIQIALLVLSNLVLGGTSGAIINAISLIRNILCYKDKLKTKEKIIITLASTILILTFNNLGFVGLLPLISTTTYIWFMNIKNVKKFKILIIFTMIMWFIYDFVLKAYTAAILDLITIVINFISIFKLEKVIESKLMKTIEFKGDPMLELEKFENLDTYIFYLNKKSFSEIKSYSKTISNNIPTFFVENKTIFDILFLAEGGIDECGKEFPDTYIAIQNVHDKQYKIIGIYASDFTYIAPDNGEEILLNKQ